MVDGKLKIYDYISNTLTTLYSPISNFFALRPGGWWLFLHTSQVNFQTNTPCGFLSSLWFWSRKSSTKHPVKFLNKYEIVFNVVRSVLLDSGYNVELEDRKGGKVITKPYEFITGSLTSSEVDKVALKKNTITGEWIRARYSVEALIEIVTPAETMVTITTKFEALNREIDGTEKWLPLESLGVIEKRLMGKISMKLCGDTLADALFYSVEPYFPGLSGNNDIIETSLKKLHLKASMKPEELDNESLVKNF
jgi:hypothetical protein